MATRADSLTTACPRCGRALRLAVRYGFLAGAVRCRSCADPRRAHRRGRGSTFAGFTIFVLIPGIFFGTLILGGLMSHRQRAARRPVPRVAPAPYEVPRERPRGGAPWLRGRERPRREPQEI